MFLKRIVYWVGLLFIILSFAVAAILFMQNYPDVYFEFTDLTGIELPAIHVEEPSNITASLYAVIAACGICAFGSYLVMALELVRLRKKNIKKDE